MSLHDAWELIRRLMRFGPLMAMATIGCLWCGGFISVLTLFPPSRSLLLKLNFSIYFSWLPFTVLNFFKSILSGPGFAPLGWKPDDPADEFFLQYCDLCAGFKPPRAHHCRRCGRCCLKMDHHCIWLSQCVGFRNQACFIYFLLGAVFGALHGTIMIVMFSYQQLWVNLTMNPKVVVAVMISSGFGIGTVIAVGALLYSQLKIVFTNKTGIEAWIVDKANWRLKDVLELDEIYEYPYDLGRKGNFYDVFVTPGNGISYPVKPGCHEFSLTYEQKMQKILKDERSVQFTCIQDYSGNICPFWSYSKVAIFTPLFSDLLSIKAGDDIVITRGKRHWYYGYKAGNKKLRGFMPKVALVAKDTDHLEEPKKEQ